MLPDMLVRSASHHDLFKPCGAIMTESMMTKPMAETSVKHITEEEPVDVPPPKYRLDQRFFFFVYYNKLDHLDNDLLPQWEASRAIVRLQRDYLTSTDDDERMGLEVEMEMAIAEYDMEWPVEEEDESVEE